MATIIEAGVDFRIQLVKQGDGTRVMLHGASVTAEGRHVRRYPETDVTSIIPPALMSNVEALMSAAEAYLKGEWEIP